MGGSTAPRKDKFQSQLNVGFRDEGECPFLTHGGHSPGPLLGRTPVQGLNGVRCRSTRVAVFA